MTRATEAAGLFLARTAYAPEGDTFEDLIAHELTDIRERYEQAKWKNYSVLTKLSSENSAAMRYGKLAAIHKFIKELGKDALLNAYYSATPQSPYTAGFEFTDAQIVAGEVDPSVAHLWYIQFAYPPDSSVFEVKHLPGEENEGWAYRFAVRRQS